MSIAPPETAQAPLHPVGSSTTRAYLTEPSWKQTGSFWLFFSVCVLSSVYALLAYVPITYFNLIRTPILPIVPWAFRFQSWIFTVAVVCLWFSWRRHLRPIAQITCFSLLACACMWLLIRSPFAHLVNDGFAASLIIVSLLPLIVFDCIVVSGHDHQVCAERVCDLSLSGIARFMLIGAGVYCTANLLFTGMMSRQVPPLDSWWPGLLAMVVEILGGIGLAAAAMLLARLQLRFCPRLPVLAVGGSLLVAYALRRSLLEALPFTIRLADLFALLFGIAVVYSLLISSITLNGSSIARGSTGLSTRTVVAFVGLLVFFYPALLREYDWNMMLQRMVCILTWWILVFAVPIGRPKSPLAPWKLAVIASLAPLLFALNNGISGAFPEVHRQMEQYSHLDISFLLATDLLDPGHVASCDEFCRYLTQNANVNLPFTVPEVTLTRSMTGEKPFNIFIVVIDNLRQDELAPYNPAVDFMPHLQEFATESTTFRNAYTRYDGTILSELALWAGTSQIHKEFAQPFARQNALAKLAQTYGYDSYVTWDEILSNVLDEKSFSFTKLDTEVHAWKEIDFCKTVPRFAEALRHRRAAQPIFFYSQPKNVHGAALALQRFPKPRRSYAGLTPYYSQAAERMDGCFGNFIQALKSEGLFDNSFIVVTSDHGDSMDDVHAGGHGLHLRPSELRVPLIVHLPKSISAGYVTDASQVAFVSDITPTIAYLLGARIIAPTAMTGRPLFTHTLAEQTAYARPFYLVESSYFPVFGILADNGTKLYLDNAQIKSREYYDLASDPKAQHNLVDAQAISQGQQRIREELDALNRWYQLQSPKNDFWHWWLQNP